MENLFVSRQERIMPFLAAFYRSHFAFVSLDMGRPGALLIPSFKDLQRSCLPLVVPQVHFFTFSGGGNSVLPQVDKRQAQANGKDSCG